MNAREEQEKMKFGEQKFLYLEENFDLEEIEVERKRK
jgi:hypothetical protein